MVSNSIGKPNKARRIPIFIVNNTNKTYNLRRGSVVGKVCLYKAEEIASVDKTVKEEDINIQTDINVPTAYGCHIEYN